MKLWWAFPVLFLAFAVGSGAQTLPGRTISELQISGLVTLEAPFVRLSIESQAGTPFRTEVLEEDVQALLGTGLFGTVEASWQPLPNDLAKVSFRLQEAPPLRTVEVVGARRVDSSRLVALARQQITGMPTESALAILRTEFARVYQEAGYYACGLREKRAAQLSPEGVLTLYVVEPSLAHVQVVGTQKVQVRDIRRRLLLAPGRIIRQQALDDSIRRLAQMGTLRSAYFEIESFSPDQSEVSLRLLVEEEEYTGEIEYGLRYERVNGGVFTLGGVRRNIFGTGKNFLFDSSLGARQSYSARIVTDWIGTIPVQGEIGFHSTETRREARQNGALTSRLDERRQGRVYRLAKTLPGQKKATLTLRDEEIRALAVEGYPLPPNLAAIGGNPLRVEYPYQALSLSLSHGPEVKPLEPTQARAERFQIEFAGGGIFSGPGDYVSSQLEHRRLLTLGPRTSLAYRVRVGAIDLRGGILPFLEQLNVGGSETMRGYLFKEFTGDRLVLSNLEYRRVLSDTAEAVAFLDWGDAWAQGSRGFDGKLSYGLGARVDIRLFRLRLDIGRALDRGGVQLSLGVGHLF